MDNNGNWEEQGTVAVFDELIHPGSTGKYDFILTTESTGKLKYSFYIKEKYDGDVEFTSFMRYNLKMNNIYLLKDVTADELICSEFEFLPYSQQLLTLEWEWPYDSGNDERDTTFGRDAGKYYLTLYVRAEAVVENGN